MTNNQYFKYDGIILIDEDIDQYIDELKVLISNNSKYLIVLLDDRNYELEEKNIIKHYSDNLNLDILMFTLNPEYLNIINKKLPDFYFTRYILQLVWIFNCLIRYNINKVYLHCKIFKKLNISYKDNFHLIKKLKKIINSKLYFKKKSFKKSSYTFLKTINLLKKNDVSKKKIYLLNNFIKKKKILIKKQIRKNEQDLFWIGFDSNFKDVPWKKKYKKNKWAKKFKNGLLYQNKLKYCLRCCMPESAEGIVFDDQGICTPCRSSEEKMQINWKDKDSDLRKIFREFKNKNYYDCILPISGGKDSTFQAYLLDRVYNLNPLAVTHGTNWMSISGRYNLENCINKFKLDHLFFLPNRKIINKVARKSADLIGDACWHCHIGSSVFPTQTAIKWKIPLLVYGESIAESDGRGSYKKNTKFKNKFYYGLDISAKVEANKYIDKNIKYSEVQKWNYPNKKEMIKNKIVNLHIGNYLFWDEQKQTEFLIREFGWRVNDRVENTYKGYKSNECIMAGVHDYLNFIKRGIGRATYHASDDLRRGLITREEAIDLIRKYDPERPHALDYYLKITNFKEDDLEKKIINSRKYSKFASKLNKF